MTDTLAEVANKIENAEPKKDPEVEMLRKTVTDLSSKLDRLTDITTQIATNASSASSNQTPDQSQDPELDPDVAKVIDSRVEKAVEKKTNAILAQTREQSVQQQWDQKAEKDFPDIFDKANPNHRDNYALLELEWKNGIYDKKSPDAVYNAAARAQVIIDRKKRSTSQKETVRSFSNLQGFTASSTGTSRDGNDELTEEQKYVAAKLGVTEETYKKLHGPVGNGRR